MRCDNCLKLKAENERLRGALEKIDAGPDFIVEDVEGDSLKEFACKAQKIACDILFPAPEPEKEGKPLPPPPPENVWAPEGRSVPSRAELEALIRGGTPKAEQEKEARR